MQDEALPARRHRPRRYAFSTGLSDGAHARHLAISTMYDSCVDDPTPIVGADVVSEHFCHGVPVAVREVRKITREPSGCRIFQPWPPRMQLVEPGKSIFEVCFVENLRVAHAVTFNHLEFDDSPLSLEARSGCAMSGLRENCAEIGELMNGLDVDPQIRHELASGAHLRGRITQVDFLD
jgi:hypothetical protein